MGIKITVDARKAKKVFKKLNKDLEEFEEALQLIADEVDEAIDLAFTQKKSDKNVGWKPWSDTTKKVDGTGGSLLNRTGRLKKSIKITVKNNEILIEARHPGAAVQQFGFPGNKAWGRGSAPVPARPYLPITSTKELTPEMIKKIEDVLEKYFDLE